MPRARTPKDVMKQEHGNKSVRMETHLSDAEAEIVARGLAAGKYRKTSWFMRHAAMKYAREGVRSLNMPRVRQSNKSVHMQVRMTQMEAEVIDGAVAEGQYKSRSDFLRAAILFWAQHNVENPAVARELQADIDEAASVVGIGEVTTPFDPTPVEFDPYFGVPVVNFAPPTPSRVEAPPVPVAAFKPPPPALSLSDLLGVPLYGADGPTPVPLDTDEEGWVG